MTSDQSSERNCNSCPQNVCRERWKEKGLEQIVQKNIILLEGKVHDNLYIDHLNSISK